jgi:hypothetical protein
MTKTHGAYIVSWDFTNGPDNAVLLVGSNMSGVMEIVNAFQGQTAIDIYEKLTAQKK